MAAFIFLGLGLACALIGRVMLIGAAFKTNIWWGIGVCLPFGPLFFRLNYPQLAFASRMFRLATLPCVFLYFVFGPGLIPSPDFSFFHYPASPLPAAGGYALESTANTKPANSQSAKPVTVVSIAERMNANAAEFERLGAWSDKLRLRKRDLLHSDVEGNRTYDLELAQYNSAVEKATAEKTSLADGK